jgi:hypothetical protein
MPPSLGLTHNVLQTTCSLQMTPTLHMLVIQVLHEDYVVPTKWILLRIWFHSWGTSLQMNHLACWRSFQPTIISPISWIEILRNHSQILKGWKSLSNVHLFTYIIICSELNLKSWVLGPHVCYIVYICLYCWILELNHLQYRSWIASWSSLWRIITWFWRFHF